ncbi:MULTISPECIES: methyl-accepting chemotaxis protein [Bradyrhizobium]|jgi:aerotaxis receptor|uniref:Blr2933 protein n=1 Tax=Bradyrhizobium diazoefficiens (strain JCM 10833 / BCRC 13528 / IAM 13628 / NBRC 14792 / USDA 110) TaxID=224911 RepID=Q89R39_BRADU|nr:methyl-accepting chemotaxis protein [Bradyrhizobium diazoefficiens]AND88390.1 chemotaxis protein [Bradyrhizobium diazoefficiens USDA 110]AWO89941.1 PAS domain-containing protein [Bradyrhizobium diazoefficiens]PDT63414.1 aerotaxis receptor [Bradyrhizobium diazoefficiens]QBP21756.1 PAS domain S-box protein [Bradyrhizobium diazoefficiens]QLD45251.1 PAS domain-containing methyl-accepting chemotaxis protein [Bradyrhizobium diazoefficiens]
MRKNFPVTDVEYPVSDETLIVSRTDLKGKLTYFNEDFLAAAGFTSAELMGQPHNIVRHPDMPPEAFDNLWDTLKAGKPWLGAVKNRRKNGDFYWVLATASPIRENGHVTGYTSIRTRLPADQRKLAEEVYAAIREKKPHGYRVDAGIIRRRSLLDRFSVFTGTLKARLVTTMTLQALFMLALGIGGALSTGGSTSLVLTLLALVGIAIVGFAGLATMRAIQGPMRHLNDTMLNLVQDKLDNRIVIERDDEIGEALRNLQTVQTIIRFSRDEVQAVQRRAEEQRKAGMTKLADGFEAAIGEIVETVSSAATELEASASTLSSTAGRAQELATVVAAGSEEASTNVHSVASAAEEMSSSVHEIGRQVQDSTRIASEAVSQAHATTERVSELSRAASRIGDVVELINAIAGQTNLLALNATIEAARAGEAGRGFAVVASEVKALAEQTAKATGEIGQQVGGIQAATQESVGAISEISGTIARLSEISSAIAAAVEQQRAATQEIARNVQQAANGTQQVSSNVGDVQRGASETGSASSQVLSAAQMLSRDSNRLKLEVGKFLNSVRAA